MLIVGFVVCCYCLFMQGNNIYVRNPFALIILFLFKFVKVLLSSATAGHSLPTHIHPQSQQGVTRSGRGEKEVLLC